MTRHLLLEGPSGSGKTTLIKQGLGNLYAKAGGFCICRNKNEAAGILEFYIMLPSEIITPDISAQQCPSRRIIERTADGMQYYYTPFCNIGLPLLKSRIKYPLFILDEIGGFELSIREFRQSVLEIFKKDIPCIGVLKARCNRDNLKRNLRLSEEYLLQYKEFRDELLQNTNITLLQVTKENRESIRRQIDSWVRENVAKEKSDG